MKLITKTKILILIIVGILFTFSPIITNWLKFNVEIDDFDSENNESIILDTKNLKDSEISGKIHIDGNSEWLDFKNDGHCTGSGTSSDPYVIKNLIIDAENSSSCIWIENSTVHFKIENCTLYNAGNFTEQNYYNVTIVVSFSAGIYLSGVSHAQIIDNNCSSNCIGIYLNRSNSNIISENIVNNNNYYGIGLSECDSNLISGNTVNSNTFGGIALGFSDYNNIFGNNAFNNSQHGIAITSGEYNSISENTVNNNTFSGICLEGSSYNTISINNVFNNKFGILISDLLMIPCYYNTILANNVRNNRKYGIGLDSYCINNDVYRNSFNNSLNAYDNGSGNQWDNGVQGNFWSDYTGLDEDGDGIGDTPYNIKGTAGSKDYYPLMKCPISVPVNPLEILILITIISGGAVISVATVLFIIRKRKRIS